MVLVSIIYIRLLKTNQKIFQKILNKKQMHSLNKLQMCWEDNYSDEFKINKIHFELEYDKLLSSSSNTASACCPKALTYCICKLLKEWQTHMYISFCRNTTSFMKLRVDSDSLNPHWNRLFDLKRLFKTQRISNSSISWLWKSIRYILDWGTPV